MEPMKDAPKKRGRKPKATTVSEVVPRQGRLNISLVEEEEDVDGGETVENKTDAIVQKDKIEPDGAKMTGRIDGMIDDVTDEVEVNKPRKKREPKAKETKEAKETKDGSGSGKTLRKSPAKSGSGSGSGKITGTSSTTEANITESTPEENQLRLVISDVSDCKLVQERCKALENRPGYFSILSEFEDVYPHRTNISCWWCCHPFDSHPIGIPIKYEEKTDLFKAVGCFCSFNCAYAHSRQEKMHIHLSDFKHLYDKMTGVYHEDFQLYPSPPRFVLKMFGGVLSIEEYRAKLINTFEIMLTPMIPFGMLCDEIFGSSTNRGWTKDGIRRPLEIRKAKKDMSSTAAASSTQGGMSGMSGMSGPTTTPTRKGKIGVIIEDQREDKKSVNQMVSFC